MASPYRSVCVRAGLLSPAGNGCIQHVRLVAVLNRPPPRAVIENCGMLFTASKWPSPRLSCQCKGGCLVAKARGQRRVVGAEQRCAPLRALPRNAPLPRPLGVVQDGLRQAPRVDVRR